MHEPRGVSKVDLWEDDRGILVYARGGIGIGTLIPPEERMPRLLMDGDWGHIVASGKIFNLPRELSVLDVTGGNLASSGNLVVIRPDGYQEVRSVEIWEGLEATTGNGPRTTWERIVEE